MEREDKDYKEGTGLDEKIKNQRLHNSVVYHNISEFRDPLVESKLKDTLNERSDWIEYDTPKKF